MAIIPRNRVLISPSEFPAFDDDDDDRDEQKLSAKSDSVITTNAQILDNPNSSRVASDKARNTRPISDSVAKRRRFARDNLAL